MEKVLNQFHAFMDTGRMAIKLIIRPMKKSLSKSSTWASWHRLKTKRTTLWMNRRINAYPPQLFFFDSWLKHYFSGLKK